MATSDNYPDIVKAFYDFLSGHLYPDVESQAVFYGNQNNIVLPENNDYCIFYIQNAQKTATTIEDYDPQNEKITLTGKSEIVCRVDIYCSSQNGDTNITALRRAQNLALLFKSGLGVHYFKNTGITPLYADDPADTSLPNSDSGNYLFRSMVNLHAYINHELIIDWEGFTDPPVIYPNSILPYDATTDGDDLHVADIDVKIKS